MFKDLIKGLVIGFGPGFFIGSILGYKIGNIEKNNILIGGGWAPQGG